MTSVRAFTRGLAVLPLVAAAALAAGAVAKPAGAVEPGLENNLLAAIYAEQQCGKGKFSQEQWQRMVNEISKRGAETSTPKVGDLLLFSYETQQKVGEVRRKFGCDTKELADLRATFARDLRPVL